MAYSIYYYTFILCIPFIPNKTVEIELNLFLSESPKNYLMIFNNLPIIKKMFLKYNTPLLSNAPTESQFSMGGPILTKKRTPRLMTILKK